MTTYHSQNDKMVCWFLSIGVLPFNVLVDTLQLSIKDFFNQQSDVCVQSVLHQTGADLLCAFSHMFCFLIHCLPEKG